MGAPKDETKQKNSYNAQKNTTNTNALKGVTPSFTLDRALTYTVGILVFGTGAYIIYRFVKSGVEGLDKKDTKTETDSGNVGDPVIAYSETIQTPTVFPVQATNLNFPSYDGNVQIVQGMLLRVFGNVLPVNGADGKFGLETRGAVQAHVNSTGIVTKSDWDTLVKRAMQMTTIAKQATQQAETQSKIAVMPSPSESTVHNRIMPPNTDVLVTQEPTNTSAKMDYGIRTDYTARIDYGTKDLRLELSLEGLGSIGKQTVECTF